MSTTRLITAPTVEGCRVGLDMIAVQEVQASISIHGERYLRRVFTDHELVCCRRSGSPGSPAFSVASLAARWAAKEATIKVLQPEGVQPEWTTMEVRRLPSGACEMHLSGTAATLAAEAGIVSFALSLTHEGDYAAAVVVAQCSVSAPPQLTTHGRKNSADA